MILNSDPSPIRLLVTGDRHWTDLLTIRLAITEASSKWPITWLIHGAATGADSIAKDIALDLGIPVITVPAPWNGLNADPRMPSSGFWKGAGPYRNRLMLDLFEPNVVYGFHDRIWESKGTKDMPLRSLTYKVPVVRLYSHSCEPVDLKSVDALHELMRCRQEEG